MAEVQIFVGNLPYSLKQEEIKDLFTAVPVTDCRLITRFQRSKGFCFVTVANQKDADLFVKEYDGKEVQDRPLKVQIAEPRKEKEPREPRPEAEKKPKARKPRKASAPREGSPAKPKAATEPRTPREFSSKVLFVGNLPFKATNEILHQVFEEHGAVKSTIVKTKTGRSKGFGYVEFKNEGLDDIIAKFSGAKLEDRELQVKKAYSDVKV